MKPSVGRVIHYMARGSADGEFPPVCRAAIITEVLYGGRIGIAVLNPTGMFFNTVDRDEDTKAGGTWHAPERVD